MSAARIPVIGIVGGVGSGKSSLANALSRHFEICRLDADAAGHRALVQPELKNRLKQTFGEEIFDSRGEVLRNKLAARVFGNEPDQLARRKQLEAIVHPWIRSHLLEELEQHRQAGDVDLIVLDAALLLESGWDQMCDVVVFADVPRELRLQRVASRGWSDEELSRREASQLPLHEKKQRSRIVVDNSRDLESSATELARQLRLHFPELLQPVREPVSP